MEVISLGIIFGLAGSFHCIGMCGPITLALPLNTSNNFTKSIGILSYNFGRIVTYSIIGVLFGVFGKGFRLAGILQGVSVFVGVVILLSVLLPSLIKRVNGMSIHYIRLNSWVKEKLGKRFNKKSNTSLLIIGLLNGLLPCGLIFSAVLVALAQGGVLEGTLFMMSFGLGTVPTLFLLPYFSESISSVVRKKMTKSIPYVVALFGILFILRGLNLGIPYLSPEFNEAGTEIKVCCHK